MLIIMVDLSNIYTFLQYFFANIAHLALIEAKVVRCENILDK